MEGNAMNYKNDNRIVMTLDAGGTNFVFSAIRANEEIIDPIRLPAEADVLDKSLQNIITGFSKVKEMLKEEAVAISFAFPGPADYPAGIIGDLGNLPCYRGGVALGPMLEEHFNIPVFINNDGDLFAYGESISGLLPEVNKMLEGAGSSKRYKVLFGVTLGTGFGGGIVRNNELFIGDNSAAGEIWLLRHKLERECFAEEGVSIRAVKRVYAQECGTAINESLEPEDIFKIAEGTMPGNRVAAVKSFNTMGEVIGDALANACTLFDGLVVIGGGLAGAAKLFLPAVIKEMNSKIYTIGQASVNRMETKAFNLEDPEEQVFFLKGESKQILVPGTLKTINYDPLKRIGIGLTRLGTSKAVAVGAYAFALNALDKSLEHRRKLDPVRFSGDEY
jgi:glucokinase